MAQNINLNINSPFLSSNAVTNMMHMADVAYGEGNNELSSEELARFINAHLKRLISPDPQIQTAIPDVTAQEIEAFVKTWGGAFYNMAHFQVYYTIGSWGFAEAFGQNGNHYANPAQTYIDFVNRFNQEFDPVPPDFRQAHAAAAAAPAAASASAGPCSGAFRPRPYTPGNPQVPRDYNDCRNCEEEDPLNDFEPITSVPLNELIVLPSGNCMRAADRNNLPTNERGEITDPYEPDTVIGGKKRKSKKSKKSKKTRNRKSKKLKNKL